MQDLKTYLDTLSAKWTVKYPDQKTRIARGVAVALSGKLAPRGLDSWRVAGSRKGVEYLVSVTCGYPSCTCPDYVNAAKKGQCIRCKHVWACALLTRYASYLEEAIASLPKAAPVRVRSPRIKDSLDRLGALCSRLHQHNAELLRNT